MELYESRVFNGILKAYEGELQPEYVASRLACDILINAPEMRATENDLWPCIWALAAALVRQFTGSIYIRTGLKLPLPQPVSLGPRVEFTSSSPPCRIEIAIGATPVSDAPLIIQGNVRGCVIMRRNAHEPNTLPARPEACFALAGYLAFEALARATGIPAFQADLCQQELVLPCSSRIDEDLVRTLNLEFLGLGHLGNSYLALMFFICRDKRKWPQVSIVDKDRLSPENWTTHILTKENDDGFGEFKANVIARLGSDWGCIILPKPTEVTWSWKPDRESRTFGILGFDNFEARRMASNAGYERIVESGLSTSFSEPLLTWHSFIGDSPIAKKVFLRPKNADHELKLSETPFIRDLKSREGGCGFVRYAGIDASAPSMGLVAAAYVWSEILDGSEPGSGSFCGTARLWSPFLPFWRREL